MPDTHRSDRIAQQPRLGLPEMLTDQRRNRQCENCGSALGCPVVDGPEDLCTECFNDEVDRALAHAPVR